MNRQRGGVLLISVIFLIVMGLMGLAAMQTSRLELRMAGNEELRLGAHQVAQSLVDAVIATPAMTPVIGGAGFTLCTPGLADCDRDSLFMPAAELQGEIDQGHLTGRAMMTAPSNSPPPRGLGYSADKFVATAFEVNTRYDRADEGLGQADITQGLIILTPTN